MVNITFLKYLRFKANVTKNVDCIFHGIYYEYFYIMEYFVNLLSNIYPQDHKLIIDRIKHLGYICTYTLMVYSEHILKLAAFLNAT
jgi:hypothetical protein